MKVEYMFIRFVSGEVHERSQVMAGLFCAAAQLRWSDGLPDYEFDALTELKEWFDEHPDSPFDYLRPDTRYKPAVCWFKAAAHEHLARAWELVAILERNDILIWTIRSHRAGYVFYEDDIQVFARPYDDVRSLLRR